MKTISVYQNPEVALQIKTQYLGVSTYEERAAVLGQLAATLGTSIKSIVQHCSRQGYYEKKQYQPKGRSEGGKEAIIQQIAARLPLSDGELESLAKANGSALTKILAAVSRETV
jgi:hypothetical protein